MELVQCDLYHDEGAMSDDHGHGGNGDTTTATMR